MGTWQDAPIVQPAAGAGAAPAAPGWQSAPVIQPVNPAAPFAAQPGGAVALEPAVPAAPAPPALDPTQFTAPNASELTDEQLMQILEAAGETGFAQPGTAPMVDMSALPPAPTAAAVPGDMTGVPGVIEAIGRGGTTGFWSRMLGLPVDLANASPMLANIPLWMADAIPGVSVPERVGPITTEPIMGSEWLNRRLGDLGLGTEGYTPSNAFERIASRTAEEVGAAALPVAGVIGAAGALGKQAISGMGPIARFFLEPAAAVPGKVAGTEMAAATAAGMGAGAARETVDPSNASGTAWADLIGAFGGLGAYGLANVFAGPLSNVLRLARRRPTIATPETASPDIKAAVASDLAHSFTSVPRDPRLPPDSQIFIDMMNATRNPGDVIPGYRPTMSEATRDPGVAATEYARTTGPNAGSFLQRRSDNIKAGDAAVTSLEPSGATPGDFRTALESARTQQLGASGAALSQAQADLDAALRRLEPATGQQELRGEAMRAALVDAQEKAARAENDLWAPVNASTEQVDITGLADDFDALTAAQTRAGQLSVPTQFTDIPRALAPLPAGNNVAMNEITDLYSQLTQARRVAGVDGRMNDARIIDQYITAVDNFLAGQTVSPGLQAQIDEARAATLLMRERFSRIETGIGAALRRGTGISTDITSSRPPAGPDPRPGDAAFRMPAAAVPPRFLVNDQGRIGDMDAFVREAGSDAAAMAALRDELLTRAKPALTSNEPADIAKFLSDYSEAFTYFPQLRREFGSAEALRGTLNAAREADTTLTRELTQPGANNTIANYLQYGDERAAKAVAAVVASSNPTASIDRLMTAVGDAPAAVAGLRKAFWEYMGSTRGNRSTGLTTSATDGTQPWTHQWQAFLGTNDALLRRLYRADPDHLQKIKDIAAAIAQTNTTLRGRAQGSSGTPQGLPPNMTTAGITSRLYALNRGVVGPRFLITELLTTLTNRALGGRRLAGYNALMDAALLDPNLAKTLMLEYNPRNIALAGRQLRLTLGSRAQDIIDVLEGGEGRPDEAAMAEFPDMDVTGMFRDMMGEDFQKYMEGR